MTLTERLAEYVRACFTGLWIHSHEHTDALLEIANLCQQEDWQWASWDLEQGLRGPGVDAGGSDPLAAIRAINSLATPEGTTLLVLQNFHRFLQSAEIVQAVARQVISGKQNRTILVVLSPVVQLPVELEKLFVVIDHELPDRGQLAEIARGIATEDSELPEGTELETVFDAAAGLTRLEAENAFSLSLVRHGRVRADVLWELKSQTLRQSGLLDLHRGQESFGGLGGLENLKAFCLLAMRRQAAGNSRCRPRGVLLLSPPGCGKSAFAKSLGQETGRPTLTLEIGSLLGSLVGQSEANLRQALQIVEAMSPCILYCDELEKGLSGVASSGQTDSGVTARLFGRLLSWLNDRTSDVFFVGTCNDISKLPPELTRAERLDGIFYIDLPSQSQRQAIWEIHLEQFGVNLNQPKPDDTQWTGAEIRSCCRLATLLDVPLIEAAKNIVPIAVTAAESVAKLRQWASGRCLNAEVAGIYHHQAATNKRRRRVTPDPSSN